MGSQTGVLHVGHSQERVAVQNAMRAAGVGKCNLVKTSSVIPPGCQLISRQEGGRLLRPGNIVFALIAQGLTKEPHQRVTPGVAWSKPDSETETGFMLVASTTGAEAEENSEQWSAAVVLAVFL